MTKYSISICYPDNANIVEKGKFLMEEVPQVFQSHPWQEELRKMENDIENAQYNPSMRITNPQDEHWLELTAYRKENGEMAFSKWFNRLTEKKILFGLFGKMKVLDVIDDNLDDRLTVGEEGAMELLKLFLNNQYEELESRIKQLV